MNHFGPQFELEGIPVGRFLNDEEPMSEGDYSYEPFRGLGHYKLGCLLSGGYPAQCCYMTRNRQLIQFTVEKIPTPGVLRLRKFKLSNAN